MGWPKLLAAVGLGLVLTSPLAARAEGAKKNWSPPPYKIYAQVMSDETMAAHPELLSVTFHGVPPGAVDTYTMYAGSYPDRIGNPDDPDDIDVIKKGITLIDPRWRRPNDAVKKFVVQMPLRDAAHENIGLIVYAFRIEGRPALSETQYFEAASRLRDALEPKIANYQALFQRAQ